MDKITYLAELAEGLARWVPERERQDILRYYAEYFEEAGPEREAQVVAELGDPWALSCRLAVEGGYVTQEQANSWTPPKRKRKFWTLAAGITAAVLVLMVVREDLWGRILCPRIVGNMPLLFRTYRRKRFPAWSPASYLPRLKTLWQAKASGAWRTVIWSPSTRSMWTPASPT